jgi:glycosyltransferase involved in cell wall biosynthesis
LFRRWAKRQGIRLSPVRFAPGDCLFVPGSFWLGKYVPQLAARASAADVPVTAFVHDVLPLSNPEGLGRRHSEQFRRGCDAVLPMCTAIICNSAHTRDELQRLVPLPQHLRIHVCRLADGLVDEVPGDLPDAISRMTGRRYVLFVSTMMARKNHKLLVEAWRRLRRELGATTPTLLFVGGGAPDPQLSAMLEAESAEGGRIVRMTDVNDDVLEMLYEHAWLTVYPSLAEGYGMPVAEALSRGRICLAAPSGGIREIAPTLIDFIDPLDPDSVVAMVKVYLNDEDRRLRREAEIKQCYRPTSWSETAQAVRSILERAVTGIPSPAPPLSR